MYSTGDNIIQQYSTVLPDILLLIYRIKYSTVQCHYCTYGILYAVQYVEYICAVQVARALGIVLEHFTR